MKCINKNFFLKIMSKKRYENDEEYVMYVLVNNDLKMGKGKIASQCMHSSCNATRILERQFKKGSVYDKWTKNGEPKIVLKSNTNEMLALIDQYEVDSRVKRNSENLWCTYIRDYGRTQIAKDSLTSVCF